MDGLISDLRLHNAQAVRDHRMAPFDFPLAQRLVQINELRAPCSSAQDHHRVEGFATAFERETLFANTRDTGNGSPIPP